MEDDLIDLIDLESAEDYFMHDWLDRTYGGAPDECSYCFREGNIVKIEDCKNPDH